MLFFDVAGVVVVVWFGVVIVIVIVAVAVAVDVVVVVVVVVVVAVAVVVLCLVVITTTTTRTTARTTTVVEMLFFCLFVSVFFLCFCCSCSSFLSFIVCLIGYLCSGTVSSLNLRATCAGTAVSKQFLLLVLLLLLPLLLPLLLLLLLLLLLMWSLLLLMETESGAACFRARESAPWNKKKLGKLKNKITKLQVSMLLRAFGSNNIEGMRLLVTWHAWLVL